MYVEYFRHALKARAHSHFPEYERQLRKTVEFENNFVSVIQEYHPTVQIDSHHLRKMDLDFKSYLKRRSGSMKTEIKPCTGTFGRWGARRSSKPIMEFSFSCYDCIYYKNWCDLDIIDRLVWTNVIPVSIFNSHCPHGSKPGTIFIID